MILPATANRFQPALSVIRSGAQMWERINRQDTPGTILGAKTAKAPAQPKDMQAINEHYFGTSVSPSEALFAVFEKLINYLNGNLETGRDGDEKSVEQANKWRDQALLQDIDVNSKRDFTIPTPGENGATFQSVARMLKSMFAADFLNSDSALKKLLEETAGVRLDGISVTDLIDAMIDQDGEAAKRVHDLLMDKLGGQPGSKVSQRLEAAATGSKSVEELISGQGNSSIDVVDEETVADDRKALASAAAAEAGQPSTAFELRGFLRSYLEFMQGPEPERRPRFLRWI